MVDGAGQFNHLQAVLQHCDEGQEQRPVQPVLIQPRGMPVRRRDHRDPRREKPLEKPPYDHRICDVGDLHLVKGQELDLSDDLVGHRRDWVIHPTRPRCIHPRLRPLHEGVEMPPPFRHRHGFGQKVHQHGLPPPDTAPQIKTPHRFGRPPEQPPPDGMLKLIAHPVESGQNRLLCGVGLKGARGDTGGVKFLDRRHAGRINPLRHGRKGGSSHHVMTDLTDR